MTAPDRQAEREELARRRAEWWYAVFAFGGLPIAVLGVLWWPCIILAAVVAVVAVLIRPEAP